MPPGYEYLTRHLPHKATHIRLSGSASRQTSPSARNEGETRLHAQYPDVQALKATMNIHRHSRCHYKWNSGSTPAGMNNLHIGGPAGQQTPGGSSSTTAPASVGRPKVHRQVLTPVLAARTRMGPSQNTSTALAAYDMLCDPPVQPTTVAQTEDGMLHPGQAVAVRLPLHGWRTPPP
jgi:hypothetical protein